MFVLTDNCRIPLMVWQDDVQNIEVGCINQGKDLTNLPFAFHHVALMPDTHQGFGMPIGGVLATKDAIIPNAVGVDIGCGMAFVKTNVLASSVDKYLRERMVGNIMRVVPTGFAHHQTKQPSDVLDEAGSGMRSDPVLGAEIEAGYTQVGTLGGGNHFIELQENQDGYLCVMLHSGSRNFGYKVCKRFHKVAQELNKKWHSNTPNDDLAFLPTDTEEGQDYIRWMKLSMEFAYENRSAMMKAVMDVIFSYFPFIEFSDVLDVHHNYATQEHHFKTNVWVHRKGAIRARVGEKGIIPGAMGSYSYIVEGLGSKQSFESCSHGAGRRMSRTQAKANHTVSEVMSDLYNLDVVLGKCKRDDVAEECRWAYKDIDEVISNELDLIVPVDKLKTLAVVKG